MLMGFLDQEVGKKMAHSESGSGLSNALLRQLKGNQADASAAEQVQGLQAAGNTLKELTAGDMPVAGEEDPKLDQQIMDELYKLNQR
jgi:Rod binding domain-containing protein